MENTFLSIFTGIIIAVFTAWFTVKLSLRKFQEEKIWERKIEAYTKIIEAFHNCKEYMFHSGSLAIGEISQSNFLEEKDKILSEKYKISQEEIFKFKDLGSLIISEESMIILNEYCTRVKSTSELDNYYDYTCSESDAAESCLKLLIKSAKKDIKLR